ncbi:MAG TPA: acetyl-CoA carboxylase carboxyltransferase subunit alpha [Pyrinomonadaceae bacterium]
MSEANERPAIERVRTARHPDRPYTNDLLKWIFSDFVEVHGDRRYADDAAMVCGFARLGEHEVCVIGQQKGRDTKARQMRNFGMPKPEGYRKALRVMRIAEKFGRPIICFIDTPGAYPGIDAEERGQAEAIAFNLREMAGFRVPIVVVILGEGGSGGALAIGIGDKVLMMENAVYSVISPEGCAAILWKDAAKADLAAAALKLTADQLNQFGLIDSVVPELGEWSVDGDAADGGEKFLPVAESLKKVLLENIKELKTRTGDQLVQERFKKFRSMGRWA